MSILNMGVIIFWNKKITHFKKLYSEYKKYLHKFISTFLETIKIIFKFLALLLGNYFVHPKQDSIFLMYIVV